MTQLVRCLLKKYENLSLNPQHTRKKPGMGAQVCNPSAAEADSRLPGACWLAGGVDSVSSRFSARSCVKNKRNSGRVRHLTLTSVLHMFAHRHICTYTCANTHEHVHNHTTHQKIVNMLVVTC